MTIEAEFYLHRNGREEFRGKRSIPPGSAEVIRHLDPTHILVFLNTDNTRGEIITKKPSRVIAIKYRDEDDETGVRVDPSKPIEIKSGQDVQLVRKTGRGKMLKETYFWFEENDNSHGRIPDPENQTAIPV